MGSRGLSVEFVCRAFSRFNLPMGNRMKREMESQRIGERLVEESRRREPLPVIACQVCARDYYQVTVYAIDQGRWRPALYLCEDHLRPEDRAELAR